MKHVIALPYPISANDYWRNIPDPRKPGKSLTLVSKKARAYKDEVGWLAKKAGVRSPILGRVNVHIQLYPALPADHALRKRKNPMNWDDNVRCIDLDNARKVLYDALKDIAFGDDSRIWRDSAERMEPDGKARVVVTIEPIVRECPQPALDLPDPMPAAVARVLNERVPF